MSDLDHVIEWFPAGTAEGEKQILDRVFVYVDEFAKIMSPPSGNPYLVIGSKGSGKSAIIDFAMRVLSPQDIPAVVLTPEDFDTTALGEASSTGDMTRIFRDVLINAMVSKLAESNTGWFDGDRATIYREAINAKERSPDFIGRLGKFVAELAKPLAKVDFNAAFPHLTSTTKRELGEAVERVLDKKAFYIFIDDTDQIANPDKAGHLNRIWSLILAVRKLAARMPELRCIVTLRSEVWERLKADPSGQRDQTDHFDSLRVMLKSDRKHVGTIVERRLSLASEAVGRRGEIYKPFFEGVDARAPYSEDRRSWRDLITVRSRERPRDAIQLVNALARRAKEDSKSLVDEDTFQSVMPVFSERISRDFAKEVALECPVALEILRTLASIRFDSGAFAMSSDQALTHFRMVISKFSVTLHGFALNQTKDSDIFELWRFFYLCGVLNARVSDSGEKDSYRHLDPDKDPTLVSKVRWNDLQKILWEVNTVYRDYLITIGKEEAANLGLAVKRGAQTNRQKSRGRRG